MQYYFKDNKCEASNSKAPDCICWHDKGTGPLSNLAKSILTWREQQVSPVKRVPLPDNAKRPARGEGNQYLWQEHIYGRIGFLPEEQA